MTALGTGSPGGAAATLDATAAPRRGWRELCFGEELAAYREEARAFASREWHPPDSPPAPYHGQLGGTEEAAQLRRRLGERGWIAQSWPPELGGLGRGRLYDYVLSDELSRAGAPCQYVGRDIVAPLLIRHGSEAARAEILPRIAAGEVEFAIGYSEEGAGTDLASLATSARRDGGDWIVDGEKLWTTGAEWADYVLLAVRTGCPEERRRGISLLIADLGPLPGLEIRPIATLGGQRTNAVSFDGVRVPGHRLIGEPNRGWEYLGSALALERITVMPVGHLQRLLSEIVELLAARPGGPRAGAAERLGRLAAAVGAIELVSDATAWSADNGIASMGRASAVKIATTELSQELAASALELLGPEGATGAAGRALVAELRRKLMSGFGGGANDVLRALVSRAVRAEPPLGGGPAHLLAPDEDRTRDALGPVLDRWSPLERLSSGAAALTTEPEDVQAELMAALPNPLGAAEAAAAIEALGARLAPFSCLATVSALRFLEALGDDGAAAARRIREEGHGAAVVAADERIVAGAPWMRCLSLEHTAAGAVLHDVPPGLLGEDPGALHPDGTRQLRREAREVQGAAILAGPASTHGFWQRTLRSSLAAYGAGVLETFAALIAARIGERKQFGKTLASFQMVQSRHADLIARADRARLAARRAAREESADLGATSSSGSAAAIEVADALQTAIRSCHQLHGGLGYRADHPLGACTLRALRVALELRAAENARSLGGRLLAGGGRGG